MKFYDISRAIRADMTLYPGDAPPVLRRLRRMEAGDRNNLSALSLGSHTGTHVDAPLHFVADGAPLGGLPLGQYMGPCRVLSFPDQLRDITAEALASHAPGPGEILLLKTANSLLPEDTPFSTDYATLDPSGARLLVERGVKTVGIDCLSIERDRSGVHDILLGAGVCVIEGVLLGDVPAGRYFLAAEPLKVPEAEGAPTRAVLIDFEGDAPWKELG